MGVFKSERTFPMAITDLSPVAHEVMEHFKGRGFEVTGEQTLTRGWHISITKGGMFAAVLGMQTALNIEIEPMGGMTAAKASVGIFGKQVIPSIIAWFYFWPVLLTQIGGMIEQSKLDDEAMACIERSLTAHGSIAPSAVTANIPVPGRAATFCTNCGAQLQLPAKFCSECGSKMEAA